jgi:predicted O-methyltransferase YrrM
MPGFASADESINAKHVVELGTANGYSGIWFALALQTTGGKLTTFEIDPQRVRQARENFKRAGVDHLITQIEGDAHLEVAKLTGPIDLVFIDADKDGYLDYLNKLLPFVRPGGLVVAHNMRVPPPDPKYVNAITTNPDLETVFLNMHCRCRRHVEKTLNGDARREHAHSCYKEPHGGGINRVSALYGHRSVSQRDW